jgi:hypothetical protein
MMHGFIMRAVTCGGNLPGKWRVNNNRLPPYFAGSILQIESKCFDGYSEIK